MSGSRCQRLDVESLVDAYRADLVAAGQFAEHPVTSVARTFLARVGLDGWARLPLADQCALPTKVRRVVSWLIVTGRLRPSADYLVACRPYLGEVAAHHHRALHERFTTVSAELGFAPFVTRLQWSATVKAAALAGLAPDQLTKEALENGRVALTAALSRHRPGSHGVMALSGALFGAETTLYHLGVLDASAQRRPGDRSATRAAAWAAVPDRLAATLCGYIEQVRLPLRPATVYHGRKRTVISEEAEQLFRSKPNSDFGGSRTVISVQAEHPFRMKPNSMGGCGGSI
ncbi:MAG: hypothetical protein GEU73_03545 [Chloroflexi bacterium]|nr:hypothetical protein [Chloroflexota bacterium]